MDRVREQHAVDENEATTTLPSIAIFSVRHIVGRTEERSGYIGIEPSFRKGNNVRFMNCYIVVQVMYFRHERAHITVEEIKIFIVSRGGGFSISGG